MSTFSLPADVRTETGKGNNRKLRTTGKIPAVIYREGTEASMISIDPKALNLGFQQSNNPNTLVELSYGDNQDLCLVKDVQRHPVSGNLIHIDFYALKKDQIIEVDVPIETSGTAAGVKMGGTLKLIQRYLKVKSNPANIPATIVIDVTELDVEQFIRASQIPNPENAEIIYPNDFNVVTIKAKRGKA